MLSVFSKVLFVVSVLSTLPAQAAIALDRTRAIFPGDKKSISLTISNENSVQPYLAQAWLENTQGEKIDTPLSVIPPLQRVDAGKKSVIRINDVAASSLPQDRESVFWLNVREIPPASDKANVLQVALQTKIKVYYRPAAIISDTLTRWDDQLRLYPEKDGYRVENPTPYYITLIAITGGEKARVDKHFKPVMIEPKSSVRVKSTRFATPWVTTINDFGGKPKIPFHCSNGLCEGSIPEAPL